MTRKITLEKTYAEMQGLMVANALNTQTNYKITNRGDRGLIFRAATVNRLENDGIRYMLCPTTYAAITDDYGNVWIGIWNTVKQATAVENNLTIWNGLVWKAGATLVGTAPDTAESGWTVIPKESFANHEYIEMIFGVSYDFANDWITKQWDNRGNKFGLDYATFLINASDFVTDGIPIANLIDWCDWNNQGMSLNEYSFIFNNDTSFIYSNKGNGMVVYNITPTIMFNYCGFIWGNDVTTQIVGNKCGDITFCIGIDQISNNRNNGPIENCISVSETPIAIFNCVNNGRISGTFDADVTDTIVDKIGTAGS